MIADLRNLPVLILGHGISGQAMARWCVRQGACVTVADTREQPEVARKLHAELVELAERAVLGEQALAHGAVAPPAPTVLCAAMDEALMARQPWALVCKSPGLSPAQLQGVAAWAGAHGVRVVGELELFAHALRLAHVGTGWTPKLLAITGTNGKTTTTSLTGQLLARCGLRVAVAGNIGPAMLDVLANAKNNADNRHLALDSIGLVAIDGESNSSESAESDVPVPSPLDPAQPMVGSTLPQVWVLELSSFQLDGVVPGPQGFEPTAATVLNISQDHLDWHGDMAHYAAAKNRVYGLHSVQVLNRDDAAVMVAQPVAPTVAKVGKRVPAGEPQVSPTPPPVWVTFGTNVPTRPGDWGLEVVNGMAWLVRAMPADETQAKRRGVQAEEEVVLQRLMPAEALRIRGRHNAANALAALALATAAGAPLGPMLYGLREYRGEPHRVESVAVVDGVEFFDDSKGTNVGATLAAIRGLGAERRLVMVMGGDGKGQDFSPLADAVRAHVQAVVLIGRDAPALREVLAPTGVPLFDAPDLPSAVRLAAEQAHAGEAVVMSPACASLDMFQNYGHRAQVFCDTVAELATEKGMAGVGE